MPSGRLRIGFPPPGTYRLNVDMGIYAVAGQDAPLLQDTGSVENPFKFTPGHYLMFDSGASTTQTDNVNTMTAHANEANLAGFLRKERWKNLESTQGNYTPGFALVDAYLDALPAGKKFILQVRDQLFGTTPPGDAHGLLPTYMDNIADGPYVWTGGASWSGTLIVQAQIDTAEGMDRLIALHQAFAARYDNDDRFEMIVTGETAVGVPGFDHVALTSQYRRFATAARAAWTRTPVKISTNFINNYTNMQSLIDRCVDEQIAIGGPDTMPRAERQFHDNEVYLGNQGSPLTDYRGLVPRVAEVDGTELGGYLGSFTPAEIWNDASYGHDNMRPTHWCWYHNTPGRSPNSTSANQWGNGVSQGILWWIRNHPLTLENTTNPYGGGGNPDPDPGGEGPISVVATGTVVVADNASVTPAYGATPALGDIGLIVSTIRAAGGGPSLAISGYTQIAVFGAGSQSPLYFHAKSLTAAEGNPTVVPTGGSSGQTVQAVALLLRNTEPSVAAILHTAQNKSTTGASSSTPIVTPAATITQDDCLLIMATTYQDNATDFGAYNPGGGGAWTRDAFSATTTGNDQTLSVWTKLQTTATNIPASTVTITGGSAVLARTSLIALKGA